MSVCDKNRLNMYIENPNLTIQNYDVDKLDIFRTRVGKEFMKLWETKLDENVKGKLSSKIESLLSFLDYHYESIPSFNSHEHRSVVYCLTKFITQNGIVKEDEKLKEWITSLNQNDYDDILYCNFEIS